MKRKVIFFLRWVTFVKESLAAVIEAVLAAFRRREGAEEGEGEDWCD